MFCSKCGAQIPDGAQFCSKCGNKQSAEQSQPQIKQTQIVQQMIQPQTKSKLAVGPFAGVMFFIGMICDLYWGGILTYVPIAVLAVYVIRQEDNAWLRKCAVRAIGTVVMFSILTTLVILLFRFIDIFQIFASWGNGGSWYKLDDLKTIMMYVVSGVQHILFLLMGIQALSMKTVKVPIVDGLIDKYMA